MKKDLKQAEFWRDEGMQRVADNSQPWFERAFQEMKKISGTMIGEDIRLIIEEAIGPPHHNNAYGSLINHGIKAGLLIPTGQRAKRQLKQSHASRTEIYIINGGGEK